MKNTNSIETNLPECRCHDNCPPMPLFGPDVRKEFEVGMSEIADFRLPPPDQDGKRKIIQKTCSDCSAEFQIVIDDCGEFTELLLRLARSKKYCDSCAKRHDEEVEKRQEAEAAARLTAAGEQAWRDLCPGLYQAFDIDRLKPQARPRVDEVMAWKYGHRGLLLLGESGFGKSFLAYQLLRRLMREGVKVRAFDCVSFGHECGKAFYNGYGEGWAEGIAKAPLVFFDDMFKIKPTDRVESELFGVIERRAANKLPILATLNSTGEMLEQRLSEDRARPMVRRLREFNDVILFA